jgi:hypothetical protein
MSSMCRRLTCSIEYVTYEPKKIKAGCADFRRIHERLRNGATRHGGGGGGASASWLDLRLMGYDKGFMQNLGLRFRV